MKGQQGVKEVEGKDVKEGFNGDIVKPIPENEEIKGEEHNE
ncbi:hypothetical protein [Bacillus thuringiensis]